ncbi:hypothetical protein [Hyalangium gracile]|uniref:hypothetical protein n=1 Tax=Hyalangium gracile TaxID=394092 RepID=UPI001CCE2568|nr:hypothetical protein [Hyalangium gracile]
MLVVWSMVLGILLFLGLVVVTLLLGAGGREREKELLMRAELERRAGLGGDVTTDTPHPIHDRYLEA